MAASFMNEYNMITTVYWWLLLVLFMVSGLTLVSSIKLANCIWNILRSGHCYLWFCCYEIRYQYYDTMEGHRERERWCTLLFIVTCFLSFGGCLASCCRLLHYFYLLGARLSHFACLTSFAKRIFWKVLEDWGTDSTHDQQSPPPSQW